MNKSCYLLILLAVGGSEQQSSDHDFIIVGGGTAGCLLANRLSQNRNWKILLLEAGDSSDNQITEAPILSPYLQLGDAVWKYKTEPSEQYCLSMENNRCKLPRGRTLGGTSTLSHMIYSRGSPEDYDNWPDWSYDTVKSYFEKIEDDLSISSSQFRTKIVEAFTDSAEEVGVKPRRIQAIVNEGRRENLNRIYLNPVKNRANLQIRKNSVVSKVIIENGEAKGVEFYSGEEKFIARARKEVVLSAGPVNSPQILMLSGIGERSHLEDLGIKTVKDVEVGFNLMDHVSFLGLTFRTNKQYSIDSSSVMQAQHVRAFLNYRGGPMSVPGGYESIITKNKIELLLQSTSIPSDPVVKTTNGITKKNYEQIFKPLEKIHSFNVYPMVTKPKSRGRVMLKDDDYKSKPLISPNYFAVEEDVRLLLEGIRLALNITRRRPLARLGTDLQRSVPEDCEYLEFLSNGYFECLARHLTYSMHDLSGTCKMGEEDDGSAVVDPKLKVHGIRGLRVVDSSVMPEIPSGHLMGPTLMIAERGADMIKDEWGRNNNNNNNNYRESSQNFFFYY